METNVLTIGYFSGGFPRVTDAFMQREIAAIEACGLTVHSFAVRPPDEKQLVSEDQRRDRARTTYLRECSGIEYARAIVKTMFRSPKRFRSAVGLALRTRRVGTAGSVRHVAYFAEAAMLAELLLDRGVEHLHNHFADASCTVAMLASALSGIPYSFTVHGPAIFFEPRDWHLDAKVETASFCVAISTFARSQVCVYSDSTTWDRIHVVHCGVDEIDEIDEAKPDRTGSSSVEFLFVGRLEPVKGVHILLQAMAMLVSDGRDVRLTIAGDGAQRAELERTSSTLGLSEVVNFVGYRSQAQLSSHLADAAALVLPSFAEGVPVSLMEAMAKGRPVVATSVGGVTELVHDGVNGLIVTPGDANSLATALCRLADDSMLRRRMAVAAKETVRTDFDSSIEARRLVRLMVDPSARGGELRPTPFPTPRAHSTIDLALTGD